MERDRATTAIWELEIFWGQAQLEGDRATTAIWELEIFWWQAQLKGDRATTAIWELEYFLLVGPVGRRQGYNCNLGIRDFSVGK